jgi:hypothetical protein
MVLNSQPKRNGVVMFTKIRITSFISIIAVVLAGAAAIFVPAGSVHAMSPADDTKPPQVTPLPQVPNPPEKTGENQRQVALAKIFEQETKNHERQQKVIEKGDKGADKLSEMIARAKENGKDTSGLEKALAKFNIKLGEARLAFDQTGRLINQHQGFDDLGKVTDPEKAKITVEAVKNGNQDVRQILREALKIIRDAGQQFRKDNPRSTSSTASNPA